jgi:hypothetical protein
MRNQGVMRLKGRCHFGCQIGRKATVSIDRRKFLKLDFRIRCKFQFLATAVGILGVGLSAHRDIFADGHGHGPGGKGSYSGRKNGIAGRSGCDQTDEQRCSRDKPVVCT